MIFGAKPSQFLLNGTVNKLASGYTKADPEFVKKIRRSFYVDDLCGGEKDVKQGYIFYKKVKIRFAKAKFNVRKWVTNDSKLREMINKDENQDPESFPDKLKVLGIIWDFQNDKLIVRIRDIFEKATELAPT